MNGTLIWLVNIVLDYLFFASLVAAISIPAAFAIIKLIGIRAAVNRHMIWLYLLVVITVLPAICLHCPKLTLAVLPVQDHPIKTAKIHPIDDGPAIGPVHSIANPPYHSESKNPLPLSPESPQSGAETQGFNVDVFIAGLWFFGILFMVARLVIGWIGLRRIRLAAMTSPVEGLGGDDKIKARILLSPSVEGPVCFGLWRPVVMLPKAMVDSAAEVDLKMILTHELAHIERRDHWINIFQRFVEAVFFFNPFIWYASFRLTQEREHICDNHVLARGSSAAEYIRMLCRIVEQNSRERCIQAVALFEGRLLTRVNSMLDPGRNGRTESSGWAKIACVAAILLCMAFATVRLQARPVADNRIYKITTVNVADANGVPVPDAAVEVIAGYKPIAQGQTNTNGIARLKIPVGSLVTWIVALKAGIGFDYYENYSFEGPYRPSPEFPAQATLALDGARTIQIRAVDSDGKTPAGVPFVPWTIIKKDKSFHVNLSASAIARVTTDNRGIAEFDWFPAVTNEHLQSPGQTGSRHGTSFLVQAGEYYWPEYTGKPYFEYGEEITARLLRNATISGKVLLPDGAAAAGITVQAEGKGKTPYFYRRQVRTAADGTYSFSVYANQTYMVAVADDKWASTTRSGIVAHPGESIENIDFDLVEGTIIEGRILKSTLVKGSIIPDPNDEPLAGRVIYLVREGPKLPAEFHCDFYKQKQALVQITKTDDNGRYWFRTGPGNHVVGTMSLLAHSSPEGRKLQVKSQIQIVEDLRSIYFPNISGWTLGVAFANNEQPYDGYTYAASCDQCHFRLH